MTPSTSQTRAAFTWLVTDIDGTLLDDAGRLPDRNREALLHCRERGVPVALATGRRWTTLRKLLDRLELSGLADYAVVNNGMVVKDLRTLRATHVESFPMPLARQAFAALESLGWDPLALAYDPGGSTDVFHKRLSLMNGDFVEKNADHSRALADFNELSGLPLVELILLGGEDEMRSAQTALAGLALETALIRNTYYSGFMLEITPAGVSKLSGARRVAQALDRTMDEAVAVGDSANDVPLFRGAGRAVAVANAPDDVKRAAHETVGGGGEAGLAEAVFRHFPRS